VPSMWIFFRIVLVRFRFSSFFIFFFRKLLTR
jgi:hypothetical protein